MKVSIACEEKQQKITCSLIRQRKMPGGDSPLHDSFGKSELDTNSV